MGSKVFHFFASLKFAVIVITLIALSLVTATFTESLYDTPTAQFYVYRSFWFHALLMVFALNIFSVAMSRLPWKKRHIPFLLAHLGILTLLFGSWITERYGIDGSLRITEGETASAIDFEQNALVIADQTNVHAYPVQWIPPSARFSPISVRDLPKGYSLDVDQFLSHADANVSFKEASPEDLKAAPAVQLRLIGGPMGISQEFWLWQGDPGWSLIQAGPSTLAIGTEPTPRPGHPQITILTQSMQKGGDHLLYRAVSSAGKRVSGSIKEGETIAPGWKSVTITLVKFIPRANAVTTYQTARVQYGKDAPPSAIHLIAKNGGGVFTQIWLGLGDRAVLRFGDTESEIGYQPRRTILPFSVTLDRFSIDHYEGTRDPSSYSSKVTVADKGTNESAVISMNEPLHHGGFTLYQSSFEDGNPRPVVSIFAVNRDPGRPWKYAGSLLIVLGAILLFAVKYVKKTVPATSVATKEF